MLERPLERAQTDRHDAGHLRAQASRCRRLAKSIGDPRTAETLTALAGEYEEQARSLIRFD